MDKLSLSVAIDEYLEDVMCTKALGTYRVYKIHLILFGSGFKEKLLSEISRHELKQWFRQRSEQVDNKMISVNTFNLTKRVVSAFFKWCLQNDLLESSPFVNMPSRPYKKHLGEIPAHLKDRSLDKKVLSKIFDKAKVANFPLYVFLRLVSETGLRISEAISIKTSDIEKNKLFVSKTKGNKPRCTFLSQEMLSLIKELLDKKLTKGEYLFVERRSVDAQKLAFYKELGDICGKTRNQDGSKITFHQFRHTFATTYAGIVDPMTLRDMLGHSSIMTTNRYVSASNDRVEKGFREGWKKMVK